MLYSYSYLHSPELFFLHSAQYICCDLSMDPDYNFRLVLIIFLLPLLSVTYIIPFHKCFFDIKTTVSTVLPNSHTNIFCSFP